MKYQALCSQKTVIVLLPNQINPKGCSRHEITSKDWINLIKLQVRTERIKIIPKSFTSPPKKCPKVFKQIQEKLAANSVKFIIYSTLSKKDQVWKEGKHDSRQENKSINGTEEM